MENAYRNVRRGEYTILRNASISRRTTIIKNGSHSSWTLLPLVPNMDAVHGEPSTLSVLVENISALKMLLEKQAELLSIMNERQAAAGLNEHCEP